MESLLYGPAQPSQPHALPFRTMFEEHLRRDPQSLLTKAMGVFGKGTREEALRALGRAICRQEARYRSLARANERIHAGRPVLRSLDCLTESCEAADAPLKRLLHQMDSSALCLSGGGIRSASFSLGILQGLSRFSDPKSGATGLMHELDYLSTVSGGGYIGSWLTSWIHRRRVAAGVVCRPEGGVLDRSRKLQAQVDVCQEMARSDADTGKLLRAVQAAGVEAAAIREAAKGLASRYAARAAVIAASERAVAELAAAAAAISGSDLKKADAALRAAGWGLREVVSVVSRQAYAEVVSAMAGDEPVTSGDAEPTTVRHLRTYTSYLAPATGLTLDTFTLIAIVLRNILVNWVMVIPVLLTLISLARVIGYGTSFLQLRVPGWMPREAFWGVTEGQVVLGAIAAVLFCTAAAAAGFSLPSHSKVWAPGFRRFCVHVFVAIVVIATWLLTVSKGTTHSISLGRSRFWIEMVVGLIGFGFVAASIWKAYRERTSDLRLGLGKGAFGTAALAVVATVAISFLTSWLLLLVRHYVYPMLLGVGRYHMRGPTGSEYGLFSVFALPLNLGILMATTSLFCALLGVFEMEQDREWWTRCGGALLIFSLVWMLAEAIAFYGRGGWDLIAGSSGLVMGLVGSLLGNSGATSAGPRPVKAAQLSKTGKFLEKHKMVLPVVGGLSLCLIALGLATIEESLRALMSSGLGEFRSAVLMFLISGVFALLINFAININLFSLQGMYRMRLMRAFLGASNVFRRADPFTNFDPKDTPYAADLPVAEGVPMHVINTTLNLTGTKNTAWSQRRAESFTFTPVLCGGWRVGYVRTDCYGGTRGVTLATAMSISGAAFNPNMGYQSSPVLSLLMTFFNLRLGAWLPNPKRPDPKLIGRKGEEFFRKSSPTCALQPLIEEALGNTDDDYRWVELTDGGHFENLGIYEMVMRRCKTIVVVDAGADPTCQFEDLGNAFRKIRIDLGIPIKFSHELGMKAGMKRRNSYCAVARIQYHCVDAVPHGMTDEQIDGKLVYIKAGLNGDEPADVLQYAKTHPTFPHETTGNQFFTESQFESYRNLGSHVVEQIGCAAPGRPGAQAEAANSLAAFVKAAEVYWLAQTSKGTGQPVNPS